MTRTLLRKVEANVLLATMRKRANTGDMSHDDHSVYGKVSMDVV